MKIRSFALLLAALAGSAIEGEARAQTQAQIDAATASAQLQEALKRESDARAAIAKNAADIANADASARAALTKAQVDAEQARSNYYQSLVPDPSKYKVAAPGTPKLNASAAIRAYNESVRAAAMIGAEVQRVAPAERDGQVCRSEVYLLPGAGMAATRTLVAASVSAEKSLSQMWSQLDAARKELAEAEKPTGASPPIKTFGPVAVGAAVVQGVLAAATIAKPQFAFDTVSETNTSGSVLEAEVFGSLAAKPCYCVVDTNALLVLVPPSPPPGSPSPASTTPARASAAPCRPPATLTPSSELAWIAAVREQVAQARRDVREAPTSVKAGGKAKPGDTTPAPAAAQAERIGAAAKALAELANDAEKALATLYVIDPQGNSPIDAAVRGGQLRNLLAAHADSVYFVTVKTIASDVDLAAKDGLFTRAATSLTSNTIASWQITNVHGRMVSSGALDQPTPTEIKDVWP